MNTTTTSIFLTAFMAMTLTGKASTIPFLFSTPAGTLGFTQTYTNNGLTITAAGYSGISSPFSVGTPVSLYGKNLGGDESGLGIASGRDYEIVDNYFIQLDFSDVKNKVVHPSAQLMIGSVQSDENYNLYGSNTAGKAGTILLKNQTLDGKFFDIPDFNKYQYFSVSSPKGNVLLDAASVPNNSVPEPGTFSLLAGAGLALAFLSRRVRSA